MASPQEIRKQTILDKLREESLTCQELSIRMNAKYHTVYKDLRELQEEGLVHYTGEVRDRHYVWAAGANAGIPEFFDPAGNRNISVDNIVAAYGASRTSASIKAAVAFFDTLEQLLNIAEQLAVGSSNVTEKDLQKIRHATIVNKSFVKNLDGYYAQLLANKNFWSVDELAALGALVQKKRAAHAAVND